MEPSAGLEKPQPVHQEVPRPSVVPAPKESALTPQQQQGVAEIEKSFGIPPSPKHIEQQQLSEPGVTEEKGTDPTSPSSPEGSAIHKSSTPEARQRPQTVAQEVIQNNQELDAVIAANFADLERSFRESISDLPEERQRELLKQWEGETPATIAAKLDAQEAGNTRLQRAHDISRKLFQSYLKEHNLTEEQIITPQRSILSNPKEQMPKTIKDLFNKELLHANGVFLLTETVENMMRGKMKGVILDMDNPENIT